MDRDGLIEAGARALYGPEEEGPSETAEQMRRGCWSLAEQVLDAFEPQIRATIASREVAAEVRLLTELHTKVQALPHAPACPGGRGCWCPLSSVLALLEAPM